MDYDLMMKRWSLLSLLSSFSLLLSLTSFSFLSFSL